MAQAVLSLRLLNSMSNLTERRSSSSNVLGGSEREGDNRLEIGTALPRVGLMLGFGSSDSWHVFLIFPLRRWTVSESCHEGLHHHF